MRFKRLLLVGLAVALAAPAAAQVPQLTVDNIYSSREFSGDLVSLRWMDDGEHFTRIERGENGVTDLYRVNARTGIEQLAVVGADLVPPGADEPIRIERYTFSPDGTKLLIFTNSQRVWRQRTKGEYYVWSFAMGTLAPVSMKPGYQMFAKFSPDGRYVAFVRDNNLFATELQSGREHQLTSDGSENVINGTSDWVYEEELGLRDAFRWSPDGERIAFWRLDQTVIKPFYLIDETQLYPELLPVRYPKAGEQNSEVRIGVVEVEGGATTWMDLGAEQDIYIADMGFTDNPREIWFTRLNRHQNRIELVIGNTRTGSTGVLFTDEDEAWVDAVEPIWIDEGRQFLFLSERDGFRHLYLMRRDGTFVRRVTEGEWDVLSVIGVDEGGRYVYFVGSTDGPLERPLYRVGLNGRGLRRITPEGGTHGINMNPTRTMYVDTYSRAGVPPVQSLHEADGGKIRELADNADLMAKIDALEIGTPEFMTVPGADGTELNAYIIKPPDFDPNRLYPLLMFVYGGPGSQTVHDSWGGNNYLWYQMLAQAGYLVASVDNRGTGARGRDFKKQTYQLLGLRESEDQVAAARYLGALPYVNADRIGIWGWSYGGYMSLMSLFRGEGVFKAAISVAPVTDWRLYDTIYTERFMRTPQENPEGYRLGAPLTYVDQMQGNLLVVHGTGDDNVHAQNTTQLIEKLEQAGKQFEMRLYPNKTHSIAGGNTRHNLFEYFTEWLMENL
jgi:dipeptidyl-peptidase-4